MKSRKKLKGMTLVEIIIAIAVFAMLGVILVGTGKVIDNTTKASSRLNKKMTIQAPHAAAKDVTAQDTDGDTIDDNFYYTDDDGNQISVTPEDITISVYFGDKANPDTVKVQKYQLDVDGKPIKDSEGNYVKDGEPVDEPAIADIDANKYSTKELVEDNSLVYDPNGPNANLNFKFLDID